MTAVILLLVLVLILLLLLLVSLHSSMRRSVFEAFRPLDEALDRVNNRNSVP